MEGAGQLPNQSVIVGMSCVLNSLAIKRVGWRVRLLSGLGQVPSPLLTSAASFPQMRLIPPSSWVYVKTKRANICNALRSVLSIH
jgi:hypothetical protein